MQEVDIPIQDSLKLVVDNNQVPAAIEAMRRARAKISEAIAQERALLFSQFPQPEPKRKGCCGE